MSLASNTGWKLIVTLMLMHTVKNYMKVSCTKKTVCIGRIKITAYSSQRQLLVHQDQSANCIFQPGTKCNQTIK